MCLSKQQRLRAMPDTRRGLRVLRELCGGPRTIEQLLAACGGTGPQISAIMRYHVRTKRATQHPSKWRMLYRVTEQGRTYVDERFPVPPCILAAKRERLERLQEEVAREAYRLYRIKNPHLTTLGFSQLTQTSVFLCDSKDNPYPACHGYPTGTEGCVFCGREREEVPRERDEED